MSAARLHTCLALLILSLVSAALAQGVGVEAPAPVAEAKPHQAVSLVVKVTNHRRVPLAVSPQHGLFQGWTMVVPPEELTLAPGESQIVPFTVLPPGDVAPGSYTFPLAYRGPQADESAEALFTIVVPPVRRLEAKVLKAPGYALAEPYSVRFAVRNAGNGPEEVALSISDNLGMQLSLQPETVHLAPGETAEVVASVAVPSDLPQPERQRLTLTAKGGSDTDTAVTARATVDLIPQQLDEFSAFHTFPLRVRLSGDTSALANPLGGTTVEVSGSGKLWDQDPGRFRLRLSNTMDLGATKNLIEYRHPDFRLAAGDQNFSLSPLVTGGNGFGVNAQAQLDIAAAVEIGVQALAATGSSSHFGLGSTVTLFSQADILAYTLVPVGQAGVVWGARARLFPDVNGIASLGLEAEYARQPNVSASAFRTEAAVVAGPVSFGLDWRRTDVGFRGASNDACSFGVTGAVELLDTPPITATAFFQQKAKVNPEALSAVEAEHRQAKFGGSLSGELYGIGWSLNFEQQQVDHGGERSGDQRLRFAMTLPLTDDVSVRQELSWKSDVRAGALVGYSAAGQAPLFAGRVRPELGFAYDPDGSRLAQLELGIGWRGPIGKALQLDVGAHYRLTGAERLRVSLAGDYQLGDGHALDVEASGRLYRGRDPSLELALGYSFPLDVPLTRLSTVGQVGGAIRDEGGGGMPGLVVQLAGQSAVTQGDGSFRFPAVPEGEHYLSLGGGALRLSQLTLPPLPHKITVAPGDEHQVDLKVLASATVQGQIVLASPPTETEQDGDAVIYGSGRPEPPAELVRGLTVKLRSGTGVYQTVTDAHGSFEFSHLPPGEWQLQVSTRGLPEHHRLDPESQAVSLQPGDAVSVEVRLIPVARTFEIIDGGEVGSE